MIAWLPVRGYEDRYEVSSNGQVWSVRSKRILKPGLTSKKRLYVNLCDGSTVKHKLVHRLVLEAFVGPCPAGMECRHLDDVSTHNVLHNLRWGTKAENLLDKKRNGRIANENTGKTHCKRGHEFTTENTYLRSNGHRQCRKCGLAAVHRYQETRRRNAQEVCGL